MKKIILLTILLISASVSGTFAQRHNKRAYMQKIINEEKIPFFTKYLDLTPQEAEKFWPLYNEYTDKKEKIFSDIKSLNKTIRFSQEISEKEAEELNRKYIENQAKLFDLLKEYNEKFKKVLPVTKVNKIYFVEREFRKYLIKQMRNHRGR